MPLFVQVTDSATGSTYDYHESAGEDLGEYVDTGFAQRCIRVVHRDFPLIVLMRPDAIGGRVEVVFEIGRIFAPRPNDLGPYRVRIGRGNDTLAAVEVPNHYVWSRWRWQSAPRPIRRGAASVLADHLVPPFSRAASSKPPPAAGQRYRPMELAGLTPDMPRTGERDDIGLLTESQAEFLATESAAALATLLAQAEASGTLPWHFRDEHTGAPLDFDRHPLAGTYWSRAAAGNDPWIEPKQAGNIILDSAHQPTLAYLPFLLTGDPYYLEEQQFACTWSFADFPPHYRQKEKCICRYDQTRTYAWSLRSLFYVTKSTPARTPAWLLPQRYWAAKLENNRVWFEKEFVHGSEPIRQRFYSATQVSEGRIAPWQEDFLAASLLTGVLMGFEEWRPSALWKLKSTLARTDGKTGWPRANCTPYWPYVVKDGRVAADWAEFARFNDFDPSRNDRLDPKLDPNYRAYTEGALALAAKLGVEAAAAPLAWLRGQPRTVPVTRRWAIA